MTYQLIKRKPVAWSQAVSCIMDLRMLGLTS